MTHRGFKWGRIPLGLMIYLFNPPNFVNAFPFLAPTTLQTTYMGITVYEPLYGGLLLTSLIFSISLFLPKFKKVINNKLVYSSCMIMLLSALAIIIIDTEIAGILLRYVCDFAWLFAFPTVIIILAMENKKFKYKDIFHKIVFILITLALIYEFFAIFVSENDYFKASNKDFWLYFYYLVQFWL